MKKLILSFLAVFALCVAAQAQTPTYVSTPLVTHKAITASTATNLNVVIDCSKQDKVTLQITSTNTVDGLTGDGAGSMKLFFKRSVDGISYDTTGFTVASGTAPNGFTAITWYTNLTSLGCGYLKLIYVTNTMAATTNFGDFSIVYGIKKSAP